MQAEFESVKAASQVAAGLAPALEEMSAPKQAKKGNPVVGAWRRSKAFIGLGKELSEASAELIDDSCDVDEPEVCTDEGKFKATQEVRKLIAKTLRFARGSATAEELESVELAVGDSMEE
jgi:hypothetical protein